MEAQTLEILKSSIPVATTLTSVAVGVWLIWVKRRFDSELQSAKTRFSWLYEARAKAMMEIYGRAIKIDESIRKFIDLQELEPSESTAVTIAKRIENVQEAIRAFNDFYQPQRLLFSADVAKALDELSALYTAVPKMFFDHVDIRVWESEVYFGLEVVAENLPQTAELLRTLESEFRRLYGSVEIR